MTSFERYPSLNGLRAASILLVIIHHINIREHMFDGITTHLWIKPFTDLLRDGQLGVNVFFVISGFLITSLMLHEENSSNGISLKNFYTRRVLRIFPAYYFLLLVYFILQLNDVFHLSRDSWTSSLIYTKHLNPGLDWITAHAWSLSIEENFYLVWPLIFRCGKNIRKSIAWAVVFAVPLFRLWAQVQPSSLLHEFSLLTRVDSIATGCLFAFYKDAFLKRKFFISKHVFYGSVFVLIFIRYVYHVAEHFQLGYLFIPLGLCNGTPGNFLVGLIMMYSVFGSRGTWNDFLNSRIMNYVGILSYSIYLWQQIFFLPIDLWALKFPQNLLFIFLVALFSHYIIERPFLMLKKKFI